jgi:hypothetical protein
MDLQKYINYLGEELYLREYPIMAQVENLFDYEWSFDNRVVGNKASDITRFYRNISEIELTIVIHGRSDEEMRTALEDISQITSRDVHANQPGRLVLEDGTYLTCYLLDAENTYWDKGINSTIKKMKVLSPNPFWVKEITTKIFNSNMPTDVDFARKYDYDYEYDYVASGIHASQINNTSLNPSEFRMVIGGPMMENISIDIGPNRYALNMGLLENEYVIIDSRKKTIELTNAAGQKINVFGRRDTSISNSIFEPVSTGINEVSWQGDLSIELTIYDERSEPKWI